MVWSQLPQSRLLNAVFLADCQESSGCVVLRLRCTCGFASDSPVLRIPLSLEEKCLAVLLLELSTLSGWPATD